MADAGRPVATGGIEDLEEGKGKMKRVHRQNRGSRMSDEESETKVSGKRLRLEPDSCSISGDEEDGREMMKRVFGAEKDDDEVSSAPSSPLCEPYIPEEIYERCPYETLNAFSPVRAEFAEKIGRQVKLPTLEDFRASCLLIDKRLLPVREMGTKAVLCAAKFVLRLSSFIDDKPLQQCSGFWIDWDEENKTGIVLTTAYLIRVAEPSLDCWLVEEQYAYDARVKVHLNDDSVAEGVLLYHQKHYDLAIFSVRVEKPVQLPLFNDGVKSGQEIFQLGRNEDFNIRIKYGRVRCLNPLIYERHHYMYVSRLDNDSEYDDGGPVIDIDGKVVGIVNNCTRGNFVPSSILLKCLLLWNKFKFIPRLHLELKLEAIKLLDPVHIEKLSRNIDIDNGLIVQEVSSGSHAEKLGIRRGDIIECINGLCISNTIELENMLLDICKGHLEVGHVLNSHVELAIQVFHIRKSLRKTRVLTANVSDEGEVVKRGSRPFIPIIPREEISPPCVFNAEEETSVSRPFITRNEISTTLLPLELYPEPCLFNMEDETSAAYPTTEEGIRASVPLHQVVSGLGASTPEDTPDYPHHIS